MVNMSVQLELQYSDILFVFTIRNWCTASHKMANIYACRTKECAFFLLLITFYSAVVWMIAHEHFIVLAILCFVNVPSFI